jgi:Ca-activated chloride channel homolog
MNGWMLQQPAWLALLIVLPAVWYIQRHWQHPPSIRFAPARLFNLLKRQGHFDSFRAKLKNSLFYFSCCCFIVALARPQHGSKTVQMDSSGLDIMLLLDVSRSMLSEDFSIGEQPASRIDVVKQMTHEFVRNRNNDRIGMICFAGKPYLVSPMTLDHDWLLQNLDRVEIGLTEDGTAIGSAIVNGANRLKAQSSKSRVIVLLTDGDNNAGKIPPLTAAEAAVAVGIKIYTIGVGTNGLVPFPETDLGGHKYYRQTYMPFQEDTCKSIARIGGGKFYRATDTTGLKAIFADIDQLEKNDVHVEEEHSYRDLFPWAVGLGLCTLAVWSFLSEFLWRKIP